MAESLGRGTRVLEEEQAPRRRRRRQVEEQEPQEQQPAPERRRQRSEPVQVPHAVPRGDSEESQPIIAEDVSRLSLADLRKIMREDRKRWNSSEELQAHYRRLVAGEKILKGQQAEAEEERKAAADLATAERVALARTPGQYMTMEQIIQVQRTDPQRWLSDEAIQRRFGMLKAEGEGEE